MGDGRYYTAQQFISVMSMTFLLVLSTILLILAYHRIDRHHRSIRALGAVLSSSLLMRLLYEVAAVGARIRIYNTVAQLSCWGYLLMAISYHIQAHRRTSDKIQLRAVVLTTVWLAILTYLIATQRWPMAYSAMALHYMITVVSRINYVLTSKVFANVQKMILDYVIIVDDAGNVVYRTDNVVASDWFTDDKCLDISEISQIFACSVGVRSAYNKDFIRLEQTDVHYFQYMTKKLLDGEKVVGHILTFIDITELINMLDEREAKREEIFKLGIQLKLHKSRVYDIEKRRAVDALMNEIADSQLTAMDDLQGDIEQLVMQQVDYRLHVQAIINCAKQSLADVRRAVSFYMDTYE